MCHSPLGFLRMKLHCGGNGDWSTGAHQVSPNLASLDRNSTHKLTRKLHNFSLSFQFGRRSATTTHHWHCQIKTIGAGAAKTGANAGISECYGVVVHPPESQASQLGGSSSHSGHNPIFIWDVCYQFKGHQSPVVIEKLVLEFSWQVEHIQLIKSRDNYILEVFNSHPCSKKYPLLQRPGLHP